MLCIWNLKFIIIIIIIIGIDIYLWSICILSLNQRKIMCLMEVVLMTEWPVLARWKKTNKQTKKPHTITEVEDFPNFTSYLPESSYNCELAAIQTPHN